MFDGDLLSPSSYLTPALLPALPSSPAPASTHPTSLQSTLTSDLQTRRSNLILYKRIHTEYTETKVTYKRQVYLYAMVERSRIPIPPLELFKVVNKIATELAMEELEVAQWSAYIEKLSPDDLSLGFEPVLLFVAYLSKEQFTPDISPFEAHCIVTHPDFKSRYSDWKESTHLPIAFSLIDLNQSLSALSKPRMRAFRSAYKDYNAMVDQLFPSFRKHTH